MISIWDGDARVARSPAYEAALRDLLRSGRLVVAHAAADAARLELDEAGVIRRVALPPFGTIDAQT